MEETPWVPDFRAVVYGEPFHLPAYPLPQDAHMCVLDESMTRYADIWRDLASR